MKKISNRNTFDAAHAPAARKKPTSEYFGVNFRFGKWFAKISDQGINYFLGPFEDEVTAARAYDAKARKLKGVRAVCNFREGKS